MKTILLIDDEQELLVRNGKNLEKAGYKVIQEHDSVKAKKTIETASIDLIISDINMPGVSGIELLKWIRDQEINLKVILITGFTDENDAREMANLGCHAFLAKPVSKKDLIDIAKDALSDSEEDKITSKDFAKVSIDDFVTGRTIEFPLYLRLNDMRFLKIAHENTLIDLERIKKFRENQVKELWIKKEDINKYVEMCKKFAKITANKSDWDFKKKTRLLKHASEVSFENMRLIGLNEDTISSSSELVEMSLNTVSKFQKGIELIEILDNSEDVLYTRAILSANFCGLVGKVMGWHSQKVQNTLNLGGFLHDIGMTQLPLSLINKPLEKMTSEEIEQYKEHPQIGYDLCEKVSTIPKDVLTIIIQHHEDGTEKAFPHHVAKSKIYPMARIVNFVDVFLNHIFVIPEKERSVPDNIRRLFTQIEPYALHRNAFMALKHLILNPTLEKAREEYNLLTQSIGARVVNKKSS